MMGKGWIWNGINHFRDFLTFPRQNLSFELFQQYLLFTFKFCNISFFSSSPLSFPPRFCLWHCLDFFHLIGGSNTASSQDLFLNWQKIEFVRIMSRTCLFKLQEIWVRYLDDSSVMISLCLSPIFPYLPSFFISLCLKNPGSILPYFEANCS